jgi:LytR cell envelope-related transcriptional attenuator
MTFARVRAVIVVAALLITAGVMVTAAIAKDTQEKSTVSDCPPGMVPAKIDLPVNKSEVIVNVFNGTNTVQLAESISDQLKFRGFTVKSYGQAPDKQIHDNIATLIFGPEAYGAAWVASANFLVDDDVKMEFDIHRTGNEVDIVLGTKFLQLASPTEVNQTIAAKGTPDLPPGTCRA